MSLKDRLAAALVRNPDVTQSELARVCRVKQPSVNGWFNGSTLTLKSETARLAAERLGCDPFWLASGVGQPRWRDGPQRVDPFTQDDKVIRMWNYGGAMGSGVVLPDQPGVIEAWRVSPEWLRLNVQRTTTRGLAIVTGFGDSMRPLYQPGDPLLVDTTATIVDRDGVYFFRVGSDGFVKRLQRIPGRGLRVLSENRELYEPWDITSDMDFEVLGRVLKVWRSEDC